MSDILRAIAEITSRADKYDLAERYYDGDVPEVFASQTLRKLLAKSGDSYKLNFTATVVDAVLNRIELEAVMGTTEAANAAINRVFEQNELYLESDEIHRRALVYGDCYVMAWPDETGEILVSYNSPRSTVIVYDPDNPRRKQFAAKLWQTQLDPRQPVPAIQVDSPYEQPVLGRMRWNLNLYYADKIVKYVSDVQLLSTTNDTSWKHTETVENPFGEIPVFHFRTNRPYGRPEHQDGFGPQDAINKLIATAMTTVDYQGAPQRYALSAYGNASEFEDFKEDGDDRENLGTLKNGPGELWYLQGVTQVGQFPPADPDAFWKPIQSLVQSMASITHTPLHYFERTINVPSGEALRAAEAPLIKKVQDRELSFGSAWRDLFRFILRTEGIDADVQVKWKAVESMDGLDALDMALKKRAIGFPLRQTLVEMGYDAKLIDLIVAWHEAEQQQSLTGPTTTEVRQGPQPEGVPPAQVTEKQHDQAQRFQANNNGGNEA